MRFPTLTILFIISILNQVSAQNNYKVYGLLLLSPRRNDTSFDLFLPCKIDTLKTLRDNLKKLKKGTAFQTSNDDFELIKVAKKIRNQAFDKDSDDDLKFCLVIPIVAEYDHHAEIIFKNIETDNLLRWPYIFYDKRIIEFYRTKQAYLKSVRVLALPTDNGG
jgi:hypothetical protein